MNRLEELKFNVEALFHAVDQDKKFFSPIYNFVEKLNVLLSTKIVEAGKEELLFLAQKIESFFAQYRPSGDGLYIPPMQTSMNDDTVKDIYRLSKELATFTDEQFIDLKPFTTGGRDNTAAKKIEQCVFIGHGRSKLWASIQLFLQNDLKLKTVCYESESRVGESIVPLLEKMLGQATYAVFVLTAEDQTEEGGKRARQNVVHEAGLFQGRLGFDRAVLLVQRGISGFSNIDGLQYIPFTGDNIEETFYQIQRALKAKGLI